MRSARIAQEVATRAASRVLSALAAGVPELRAEAAGTGAAAARAAAALDQFQQGRAAAAADHDVHLDLQQGQVGAVLSLEYCLQARFVKPWCRPLRSPVAQKDALLQVYQGDLS